MQNHDPSQMTTAETASMVTPGGKLVTQYEADALQPSPPDQPTPDKSNGPDPSMVAPPIDIVYPEERVMPEALRSDQLKIPVQPIQPIQPLILRRTVSGSYSGTASGFKLDLRVDVDRPGMLNTASFDFFTVGAVTAYYGSFVVNAPSITYSTTSVLIDGFISGTRTMWANRVKIQIARNTLLQPAGDAKMTLMQNALVGFTYTCAFQSPYFRTVKLETDCEVGTTLAGDYDTAAMPCPGPNRVINVVKAYQEAGINMVYTGSNNSIQSSEGGSDSKWTESEMHASMVKHFSVFNNQVQWAVWLFAARKATSSSLLGIMFDYLGLKPHRQGCAVFQDTVKNYHPSTADYNRHLLYTYVHELGHAFNLLHSWDKTRPDSLSWMNYDWKYDSRNGAGSYWTNFNFIFDPQEIKHMRHGFRNNVIMGGNNWAVGAGLEAPHSHEGLFATEMEENRTGVKLLLEPIRKSYALGEPLVVELKLKCMDLNGVTVNANIHPKYEQVKIGIMKPNGKVVTYEPVAHNCAMEKWENLNVENNTVYASAYIGYGKEGFYFDQPGFYRLKAAYLHHDGSIITSEEVSIRIKSPLSKEEDDIADLYFSNEAGMQFYMLGSDSPSLQRGLNDLRLVADKYDDNNLSVYANLILGVNEGMKFKVVDPKENKVETRRRDLGAASKNLTKVFNESKGEKGVDNITLNWAYRHLAKAFLLEGDEQTAKSILHALEQTFENKNLRPAVKETIKAQSEAVLRTT